MKPLVCQWFVVSSEEEWTWFGASSDHVRKYSLSSVEPVVNRVAYSMKFVIWETSLHLSVSIVIPRKHRDVVDPSNFSVARGTPNCIQIC